MEGGRTFVSLDLLLTAECPVKKGVFFAVNLVEGEKQSVLVPRTRDERAILNRNIETTFRTTSFQKPGPNSTLQIAVDGTCDDTTRTVGVTSCVLP